MNGWGRFDQDMAGDGSQQRKPGFKTAVEDVKALATVLAMEAESVLGRRTSRVLGALALFAAVGGILVWYIAPSGAAEKQALVVTLAQILGGTALLSGLYFTWHTLQVNREGQITDRFTQAIEQLGSKEIAIRIGGIYALERIAGDSERDRLTVTQVLSAYIRTKSPGKGGELSAKDLELSSHLGPGKDIVEYQHQKLDVQAALNVIKSLLDPSEHHEDISGRRPLYLNNTDLKFADLREANLKRASIRKANLLGSRLDKCTLEGAHLRTTILVGARLRDTNFEGADLEEVNFNKAHLQKAKFKAAKLSNATFSGANLNGADLRGAKHLTQRQLEKTMIGDKNTKLPPGLKPPAHWDVRLEGP